MFWLQLSFECLGTVTFKAQGEVWGDGDVNTYSQGCVGRRQREQRPLLRFPQLALGE